MDIEHNEAFQAGQFVADTLNTVWSEAVDEVVTDPALRKKVKAVAAIKAMEFATHALKMMALADDSGSLDSLTPQQISRLLDEQ